MTDSEWLAETRPERLLSATRQNRKMTQLRKYRLLMVACCRDIPPNLLTRPFRAALDVAERFADGRASLDELQGVKLPNARYAHSGQALRRLRTRDAVRTACEAQYADRLQYLAWYALICLGEATAAQIGHDPSYPHASGARPGWPIQLLQQWPQSAAAARDRQTALIRDIFDHTLRRSAFNPRWRTADAVGLARSVYEERAFNRLPILADALMDAGCADDQVVGHCRSEGPHVRGCWVVDQVIGAQKS